LPATALARAKHSILQPLIVLSARAAVPRS
jgi:hypothetical protein